jgi:hypothetical protein
MSEGDLQTLFDNLGRRSNNIREISITKSHPNSYMSVQQAISCVLKQRWPVLQALTLEDLARREPLVVEGTLDPLIDFLGLHPTLRELRLPSTNNYPGPGQSDLFSHLALNALPHLGSFQGMCHTLVTLLYLLI